MQVVTWWFKKDALPEVDATSYESLYNMDAGEGFPHSLATAPASTWQQVNHHVILIN